MMTYQEIRRTYEANEPQIAYEIFMEKSVTYMDVARYLGPTIGTYYCNFLREFAEYPRDLLGPIAAFTMTEMV